MTSTMTRGSGTSSISRPDPSGLSCTECGWRPGPGELWPSQGRLGVRWIEDNLIFAEGDFFGLPFRLRDDQKTFIYEWLEHCPRCGQWHYDQALWGAASGDGKTALVAALIALDFAGPPSIAPASPIIPVAAASFEQADKVFGAVATMFGGKDGDVREAPLNGFFEVYDTEIKFADGRPGRIFRIAAKAGTAEGDLPSLFVADELHEWGEPGDTRARVHTVMAKSTRKRRTRRGSGRILNLSTAGADVDHSLLGAMYKQGKRRLKNPAVAPRFLFRWHEAPDGLDYEDPDQRAIAVAAASPGAGVQFSIADRVADWNSPSMPKHEWQRYYANRWAEAPDDSWLADHPAAWPDCEGEWDSEPGSPFVLAVDMALKHDSVAVDRVELLPDGRLAVTTRIWRAGDFPASRIPHKDVFAYIKAGAVGESFHGVVYDPRFFQLAAEDLEDEGIEVIEFDQNPARMAPACGHTLELILAGQIVHDGDPDLTDHVLAAVPRQQERGFTLAKGKSRRHIDACVAMCMGVWVLAQIDPEESDLEPYVGVF